MTEPKTPPGFYPYKDNDRLFYASVGPLYVRNFKGDLQFGMLMEEKHMNAGMITHGGVLMYLMDMQLSLPIGFSHNIRGLITTVNMTTDFLEPSTVGDWIQGETRLVRLGKRTMVVDGLLTANGERPILRANGIMSVPPAKAQENGMSLDDYAPPVYDPDAD